MESSVREIFQPAGFLIFLILSCVLCFGKGGGGGGEDWLVF